MTENIITNIITYYSAEVATHFSFVISRENPFMCIQVVTCSLFFSHTNDSRHTDRNILRFIEWIAMKCCTDIHGPRG